MTAHTRRADAQAADCEVGQAGERATAVLLAQLEAHGWKVLHDRALPGARRANADHIVISPGARVYVVDSKLWSAKTGTVWADGGRLMHGRYDRSKAVRSLEFERTLVGRALQAPVTGLIVMHRAPVAGSGFFVGGIPVVPAARLVMLLVGNDGPRNAGAVGLAALAERVFPRYPG